MLGILSHILFLKGDHIHEITQLMKCPFEFKAVVDESVDTLNGPCGCIDGLEWWLYLHIFVHGRERRAYCI